MIYIAINVIFNAFVLFFIFAIGSAFVPHHHLPEWVLWDSAFAVSALLAIIGYTRFAAFFIGVFIRGRKPAGREMSRIQPLLEDVIKKCNLQYATTYKMQDFTIKITDSKIAEVAALGFSTLIIGRGALNTFNDEQLRAVLAHELGHIFYRDSVRNIALIFSAFATRIVMWLYSIYIIVLTIFDKVFSFLKSEGGKVMVLAAIIPLIMFLPVVILNWLGTKLFNLSSMWLSRGAEYRADNFTASLGYKADMISALEILDNISVTDNSFLAKLVATHPAPMLRISALEDEQDAKKKIGKLFIASLSTNSNSAVGGASEITKLIIVLAILGVVWAILSMKI